MKVFHGSSDVIEKPDIEFSKTFLDFGRGFYLTSIQKQAERWAARKAMRVNGKAFLNVYEMNDDLSDFKVLEFEDDEEWLDFVCNCRKGDDCGKDFDIIAGKVADDDVFKVMNMYFQNLWDKKRTLEELKFYMPNDQICIKKQDVLSEVLRFQKFTEVQYDR